MMKAEKGWCFIQSQQNRGRKSAPAQCSLCTQYWKKQKKADALASIEHDIQLLKAIYINHHSNHYWRQEKSAHISNTSEYKTHIWNSISAIGILICWFYYNLLLAIILSYKLCVCKCKHCVSEFDDFAIFIVMICWGSILNSLHFIVHRWIQYQMFGIDTARVIRWPVYGTRNHNEKNAFP